MTGLIDVFYHRNRHTDKISSNIYVVATSDINVVIFLKTSKNLANNSSISKHFRSQTSRLSIKRFTIENIDTLNSRFTFVCPRARRMSAVFGTIW